MIGFSAFGFRLSTFYSSASFRRAKHVYFSHGPSVRQSVRLYVGPFVSVWTKHYTDRCIAIYFTCRWLSGWVTGWPAGRPAGRQRRRGDGELAAEASYQPRAHTSPPGGCVPTNKGHSNDLVGEVFCKCTCCGPVRVLYRGHGVQTTGS